MLSNYDSMEKPTTYKHIDICLVSKNQSHTTNTILDIDYNI